MHPEIEEIKAFLDGLLDQAATPADTRAIEDAFCDRLRAPLATNHQVQWLAVLDALAQAVLNGDTQVTLGGSVILLPEHKPKKKTSKSAGSPPRGRSRSCLRLPTPPRPGKGKGKAPARRGKRSPFVSRSSPAKKSRTSSSASSSTSAKDAFLGLTKVSRAAPEDVRDAIAAVLEKAAKQVKKPWRLAYPFAGQRLWYNPACYSAIYREHWRVFMAFRAFFWRWAFNAPLESMELAGAHRRFKLRANQARIRFISLCIETWRWYDFQERLEGHDRLFWYGGAPGKGSNGKRTDGGVSADDLGSLYRTDPERFQFVIEHVLDPEMIDDYGIHNVRAIVKQGDTLDPHAKPAFRLSLRALARIRRDIISKRAVKAAYAVDTKVEPWKTLKNSATD